MDWINNYTPLTPASDLETNTSSLQSNTHILWAADVWHSIKRHWVLELQRMIRARRILHHAT